MGVTGATGATGPQGIPGPTGPPGGTDCTITGNAYALQNESIAVIDPNTHQEIGSFPIYPGNPNAFAVNPSAGLFYVATGNGVQVFDGEGNNVMSMDSGFSFSNIAYNPTANKIYAARYDGELYIYDAGFYGELDAIQVEPGMQLAVDPVTNQVFAAGLGSGIYVISGASDDVVTVIPVMGVVSMAMNPSRRMLYAADDGGYVHIIDTVESSQTGGFNLPGGMPIDIAINPNTDWLYANYGYGIDVIDTIEGSPVDVISAANISEIAVDPAANQIYYYAGGTDTVVLDGNDNSEIGITSMLPVYEYAFGTLKQCAGGVTGPTGPTGAGACSEPAYAFFASDDGSEGTWTRYNPTLRTEVTTGNRLLDIRYTAADPVLGKVYGTSTEHTWLAVYSNGEWDSYSIGYSVGRPVVNTVSHLVYIPDFGRTEVHVFDGISNQSLDDIAVDGNPQDIAVDPDGNRLFVATLTEIEARTLQGAYLFSIPAIAHRIKANPCNGDLYAAMDSGGIKVYDGKTGDLKRTLEIDARYFDIDTGTNQLVAWTGGQRVVAWDLCAGELQWEEYRGIPDYTVFGLTVDPVNHLAYLANSLAGTVDVYSMAAGLADSLSAEGLTSDVAVMACGNGCRLCCDPCAGATGAGCTIAGNAYALQNGNIAVVSPNTHVQTGNIAIGPGTYNAFALNPSANVFYVAMNDGVQVFDKEGSYQSSMRSGDAFDNVVYNPTANKVYAARDDGTLYIFEAEAYGELDNFTIETNLKLAVDPATNQVYAAGSTNGISVVSGESDSIVTVIPVTGVVSMTVDPSRHLLYAVDDGRYVNIIDTQSNSKINDYYLSAVPMEIAVNPNTNWLYANFGYNLIVIDAVDGSPVDLINASNIISMGVDPVANQVYYYTGGVSTVVLDGRDNSELGEIPMAYVYSYAFDTQKVCGAGCSIFVAGESNVFVIDLYRAGFVSFAMTEIDLGGDVSTADGSHFRINSTGIYEINVRLPIRSEQNPQSGDYQFVYAVEVNGAEIYAADWHNTANQNWQRLVNGYVQLFRQLNAGDEIAVAIRFYDSINESEIFENLSIAIRKIC